MLRVALLVILVIMLIWLDLGVGYTAMGITALLGAYAIAEVYSSGGYKELVLRKIQQTDKVYEKILTDKDLRSARPEAEKMQAFNRELTGLLTDDRDEKYMQQILRVTIALRDFAPYIKKGYGYQMMLIPEGLGNSDTPPEVMELFRKQFP